MPNDATHFDLVVIGGGPGGYGTALYGAAAGLNVALVEMHRVGGTCLHVGCIPAKELLETAHVLRTVRSAGEFGVRHLGERYASEAFYEPALSGYTVLDLGLRYVWRFLEVGLAVENLANTEWRSSEFYYDSRPIQGGASMEDFHFTPGNPRNVRGWVTARF